MRYLDEEDHHFLMVFRQNVRSLPFQFIIMRIILTLIMNMLTVLSAFSQVTAMSYNIRYSTPNDGDNWWQNRRTAVVELIQHYQPDFLGIQEGLNQQVSYLDQSLEAYQYTGIGRDGEGKESEFVAIFYRGDTYSLLDSRTFWLSETPDQVSKGWDAALNRICTYGRFKHRITGVVLHVFNTHFDHVGKQARKNSSQLILQKIRAWGLSNEHIILLGDLNSTPDSVPIQTLNNDLQDSREISDSKPYGPIGTFNAFDKEAQLQNRIDYVFVKNLKVTRQIHVDDRRDNGLWVSDHLPVFVSLEFPN